jgi:hypothetical protein
MGERTGTSFEWNGRRPPLGRSWKFSEDRAKELERQGMISFSSTGMPRMKRYLKESSQVLQREFEQLPHKKFKFETELIASITPTLTSALGYSEEEIFFDYGRRNYRADFVVSESIESKPWVIFEVKNRRTQDTSSWIEQLQSYLTEFNVKKGVLISPEKLIVISEGIVKQFDLNNITFAETLEIVQSIARSDEDTSLPTEKSKQNQQQPMMQRESR